MHAVAWGLYQVACPLGYPTFCALLTDGDPFANCRKTRPGQRQRWVTPTLSQAIGLLPGTVTHPRYRAEQQRPLAAWPRSTFLWPPPRHRRPMGVTQARGERKGPSSTCLTCSRGGNCMYRYAPLMSSELPASRSKCLVLFGHSFVHWRTFLSCCGTKGARA